ncbi:MAG: hypothetical protein ACLR1T_09745 [Evtepia gabavorous]
MNLHRSEISRRWAAILARLKETRHIIALSVFLILSMWYLFGAVNITIPTVISLLYIFKYQQAFRLRDVLRISLRMTVLCGAAIVCWVNLPLCILGNLAVPLGLVYSLSDRFTPKAYYIYRHGIRLFRDAACFRLRHPHPVFRSVLRPFWFSLRPSTAMPRRAKRAAPLWHSTKGNENPGHPAGKPGAGDP